MTATAIVVERVGRDYPTPAGEAVRALDAVDLDIQGGTSVAVTGPSGCGKSTVLGLLAGLEVPTTGRISLGGVEISALPDADRARIRREQLGLVFQSDNLLPFLTAVENVALHVALAGGRDHDRAAALLSELGLSDHAHKLPDQLSGGQRQRVAIAGALVKDPRLILADEPTGSLDEHSSDDVIDLLVEAQRERGATLVVVTHDPDIARRMDRTIRLLDGRVVDAEALIAPRETERSRA